MKTQTLTQTPTRPTLVQIVVAVQGIVYLLTSLALLFAPEWFFENIGHFPPFNRHYMGDAGAFLGALAVGLLIAARDPSRHRVMLLVAALGGLVHIGNHLYDDTISASWSLEHALTETLPLAIFALAMLWGWYVTRDR